MAGKKILVLGATGPLGVYFCQKALANGHQLTIYARNPSKLPEDVSLNAAVNVIKGELTNEELLISTVEGKDVIVSVLGPVVTLSSRSIPPGTLTNAYRIVFKAMRKFDVKRIFLMGTPTISDPRDKGTFLASTAVFALRLLANSVYNEMVALGKLIDEEAKDFDWTMYRVGALSNSEGEIVVSYVGDKDYSLNVYRPDIAGWIVKQLEKEIPEYIRERPALSSRKKTA